MIESPSRRWEQLPRRVQEQVALERTFLPILLASEHPEGIAAANQYIQVRFSEAGASPIEVANARHILRRTIELHFPSNSSKRIELQPVIDKILGSTSADEVTQIIRNHERDIIGKELY